ncbi:DUF3581 family protein [Thalassotalea euphylliae]|uniref:DUF3581 family protein n=1 Tax=Thalassotalea euphylliae TaxID=1655234 RepID=UPI003631F891
MFVEKFFNLADGKISYTRKQASEFAKQVADDFNPLHDEDAKRFCVPGDLLFATTLATAGISQNMRFTFSGMVTDGIALHFPGNLDADADICDDKEKTYMSVSASGEQSTSSTLIESLIRAYVGFSGHTFPHILCDLMAKNDVMINPARPMIMYESMALTLDDLSVTDVSLELAETTLSIDGKRGNACLRFNLFSNGKQIGQGEKHMVLSGLRPYCGETISKISEDYIAMKASYHKAA